MNCAPALAVSELPTAPFPELQVLDEKGPLPRLAEFLQGSARRPRAESGVPQLEVGRTVLSVPQFPPLHAPAAEAPPAPIEEELDAMPVPERPETFRETLAALMEEDQEQEESPPPPSDEKEAPPSEPPPSGDSTDHELAEAFRPLVRTSLQDALFSQQTGLQSLLEPMLRNTVRRAIAEQMENSRQFREIGALDRFAWRLRALFTSRSYDDIVFDRTRRYQVEEAYLLRRGSKSLVSYASHDPSRHANPRRVRSTIRRIASQLPSPETTADATFELPENRLGLVREGQHCLLVAVLRGRSNALVRADLDYILRQAEDRFGDRLEQRTEAFIPVLQPLLEGCLLIQSPAPPH